MTFVWDPEKERTNHSKHGITFAYAARIFLDPHRIELEDTRNEYAENRIKTIGMVEDRVLVVVYTDRDEATRIISARRAVRHERRQYHEIRTRPS